MLTAKQANLMAREAESTASHINDYTNYLLGEVQSAAKRNEFQLTCFSTRSDVVTAKVIDKLKDLGYIADMTTTQHGSIEIHIAWDNI